MRLGVEEALRAEIKRLKADLKQYAEIAGCCYAESIGVDHCDPTFCRCGKAPVDLTA